jgi:hypothetical protein
MLAVSGLGMTACSSASNTTASVSEKASGRPSCVLQPSDSVYLKSGPVYRDCGVDQKARRASGQSVQPNFNPSSTVGRTTAPGTTCYVTEIEFVVDARGTPEAENARVVRTTDPAYSQAWLDVLSSLRYEPAAKAGVPVRQVVREKFMAAITVARAGQTPAPPNCH